MAWSQRCFQWCSEHDSGINCKLSALLWDCDLHTGKQTVVLSTYSCADKVNKQVTISTVTYQSSLFLHSTQLFIRLQLFEPFAKENLFSVFLISADNTSTCEKLWNYLPLTEAKGLRPGPRLHRMTYFTLKTQLVIYCQSYVTVQLLSRLEKLLGEDLVGCKGQFKSSSFSSLFRSRICSVQIVV